MPTAPSITFTGTPLLPFYPQDARMQNVKLPASVTYTRGTVLGEISATPGTFKAYASGNTDGTQKPTGILAYDASTDASGNITWGGAAGSSEWGATQPYVPVFYSGTFATGDLTGLDATALTNQPSWHLISGTVTSGILVLP